MLPGDHPCFYPRKRRGNVCQHLFVSSKSVNILLMTSIAFLILSNSLFSRVQTPVTNFPGGQDKFSCGLGLCTVSRSEKPLSLLMEFFLLSSVCC